MSYHIEVYETRDKKRPLDSWLDKLNSTVKYNIIVKLERIELGNFGSCKTLGDGISEIKIDIGPGYRIYYSIIGLKIILLLCAGNKKTQQRDIQRAKEYLKDYKERGKTHGKK